MNSPTIKNILVFTGKQNSANQAIQQIVSKFCEIAAEFNIQCAVSCQSMMEKSGIIPPETNLACSIGGDGTFVYLARQLAGTQIPLLGLNTGSLGFLADISPNEIPQLFKILISGDYQIEPRTILNGKLIRNNSKIFESTAINDIYITRKGTADQIAKLDLFIDSDFACQIIGDGIIICTPTGSTGYNLSALGPVISSNSRVFGITPLVPHLLALRPTIVPDSSEISIKISSPTNLLAVCFDGNTKQNLNCGDKIIISRSQLSSLVIKPFQHGLFEAMRHKLGWGVER